MNNSKDAITSKLITIMANETLVIAYKLMKSKNIRHLPVTDERNKIVGILSDRDIQRGMQVTKVNTFQQEISLNGELKVEDFMSWPVYTVSEETPIKKVVSEMLSQKVSAFLVQDNFEQIKGIITTDDILKLFLTEMDKEQSKSFNKLSFYFNQNELY